MLGMQHHILKSFRRRLKRSSHGSKSQGSQEGMTDIVQMEELEEAERQAAKPAWKTKQFWRTAIPILVSVVLLVVGTVLGAKHYQRQVCVRQLVLVSILVCMCQSLCRYPQAQSSRPCGCLLLSCSCSSMLC